MKKVYTSVFLFLGFCFVASVSLGQNTYTLVTSTNGLVAGGKYLLANGSSGTVSLMGYQNTNNRPEVTSIAVTGNKISVTPAVANTETTAPFEITLGGSSGAWVLNDGVNSSILGPSPGSNTNNYLKLNSSATFTITFSSNAAVMTAVTGTNTTGRNIIRFNPNSGSGLFSCYASGQNAVYLFKRDAATDYFRSKTTGNWSSTATWESSGDNSTWGTSTLVPTSSAASVSILATHTVTMDASTTVGNVTIAATGSLAIAPNVYVTIPTTKTVTNNGTFVLKSDATGTGGIDNSAGSITGNVTAERYLTAQRAYRLLGHPFNSNIALSSIQPYVDISGSGSGLTPGNASAFNYTTGAWSAYTDNTQTWDKNQGLLLFVRGTPGQGIGNTNGSYTPSAPTISLTGTVNAGNFNYLVKSAGSFSNGTAVGWNAIGNPYPAPIDVNSIGGITAPGGSGASIYVWNATKGSTGNGIASGGYDFYTLGSNIVVPTYGAFFIKNTSGLDQFISFTEGNKNTSATPLSLLRANGAKEGFDLIIADNNIYWDKLRINLDNTALATSADRTDLDKFSNTNLDFYSISSDKNKLAVNSHPQFQSETDIIALGLKTNQTRTFTVSADNVNLASSNYELYLHDKYADRSIKIAPGMGYSFVVTADVATQGENRFEVIAKKAPAPVVLPTTKITIGPNPVTDQLTISSTGNTTVRIITALGQVVKTVKTTNQTIQVPINNLSNGLYIVEVKNDNGTVTEQIVKQ